MLLKPSHRVAANAFLDGVTKTEACRRAGYKQPKHAAQKVFSREDVQLYLKQKQEKLAERHDTTKDDIAAWCWDILGLNPIDITVRDEKGNMRMDLASVHASAEKLLKSGSLNYSETRNGAKVSSVTQIKGLDGLKKFAIHTLCQMYGFYDNTVEVKGEISLIEALQRGRHRVNGTGEAD